MTVKEISRFEVFCQLQEKAITKAQAADLLGISIRQVKRLFRNYKQYEVNCLISNKLGKMSNHKMPKALRNSATAFIVNHYIDFWPTLACEKLMEMHNLLPKGDISKKR